MEGIQEKIAALEKRWNDIFSEDSHARKAGILMIAHDAVALAKECARDLEMAVGKGRKK